MNLSTVSTSFPNSAVALDEHQARLWGTIEAPSNASPTVLNIMAATGNVSDTLTVYRGSSCIW